MTLGVTPLASDLAPTDENELEERLSRPTLQVLDSLTRSPGDILVLGAGGKMGPSLTAMAKRAVDSLGDGRSVYAASRWSSSAERERLRVRGVQVLTVDLADHASLTALPLAPNVIFMAGQKFGTQEAPHATWMTNTIVPYLVAERYRASRLVVFSTGNVYGLSSVAANSASREGDALAPLGEYAASCVGRERVFEHAALAWGTLVSIVRLNYAVDLRYGVLVDLAQKVMRGDTIDLGMGYVNCIWQGDANAVALSLLSLAQSPPLVMNVTGAERLSVREVALEMGRQLGHEPHFSGQEGGDALLSDTTRMQALFGTPATGAVTLARWVAQWLQRGGRTIGKATRFERRDGAF